VHLRENLCKTDLLKHKDSMPVPTFSSGVKRKFRMIVRTRYGRPMQACAHSETPRCRIHSRAAHSETPRCRIHSSKKPIRMLAHNVV
jgi:hypothetical protein